MKRSTIAVLCSGAFFFSAAAFGISSQFDSPPSLMSRSDYASAKQSIQSEAKEAIARCRAIEGDARELCRAQVRADERVRQAELVARYRGTYAAAEEAKAVKMKAEADLARARCSSTAGADRGECLTAARADKARADGPRPAAT